MIIGNKVELVPAEYRGVQGVAKKPILPKVLYLIINLITSIILGL